MIKLDAHYWDNRYIDNTARWDLGKISPPLKLYFDKLTNSDLKILIPGGGNSYEAEYLHKLGFKNVFVIDLAKTPLKNIKQRIPDFPVKHLITGDFFELNDTFHLIIEQTFFCALNPLLRPNYVEKMSQLLNTKGKIAGLLFDDILNKDHPPFGGTKKEYLNLFATKFRINTMETAINSDNTRKGRELFFELIKI